MNENKKKIYCVIPAYNEALSIGSVIRKVKPLVDTVVVVNDGSKDATKEISEAEGVIVLSHIINRGQGAALSTGNVFSLEDGADVVVNFDADDQFLAEEIKDVVGPILRDEADVVFGSRFMGKVSDIPVFKKNVIMPLGRLVNRLVLGVRLTDPSSGFRAMNRLALGRISIDQDGMAHCSEIIYKSFKNKLRVKEVPTTVIYHEFGQSVGGGFKILYDLMISRLMN